MGESNLMLIINTVAVSYAYQCIDLKVSLSILRTLASHWNKERLYVFEAKIEDT